MRPFTVAGSLHEALSEVDDPSILDSEKFLGTNGTIEKRQHN